MPKKIQHEILETGVRIGTKTLANLTADFYAQKHFQMVQRTC